MLNTEEEIDHRRLRHELEQSITAINRSQIGAVTGAIDTTAFINVVKMMACLRARYLHQVLDLARTATAYASPPRRLWNCSTCARPTARHWKASPLWNMPSSAAREFRGS